MGRKTKCTKQEKIKAIKDYKSGKKSGSQLANELKTSETSIHDWIRLYDSIGPSAFDNKPTNKSYSKEFKLKVVKEYLSGRYSKYDLQKKYKLYNRTIIRRWIKEYTKGNIKDYKPKPEVYTMKARKTSYEERVEIVNYCISHNNDYKEAADKYTIPYSLVYQWVKKYNTYGIESLKNFKKGRKPKVIVNTPLTHEEELEIELEKTKRELERVKFENEVLKKKKFFELQRH